MSTRSKAKARSVAAPKVEASQTQSPTPRDEAVHHAATPHDAVVPQETAAPQQTAGGLLRAMREDTGHELESLASALKVSPRKIQALEDDHPEQLPGVFFARGLAANICRYLGKDAQPVLALMRNDSPVLAHHEEEFSAPFVSSEYTAVGERRYVPRWVVAFILLCLLGAALVFFWPHLSHALHGLLDTRPSGTPQPVVVTPATVSTTVPVQIAPTTAPDAASAPVAPASAIAPGLNLSEGLLFRAKTDGDVWVQVKNQRGKTIFERTLSAGTQEFVRIGQYPVKVSIGRVESAELFDRGTLFDLSGIATQGVARFELK